MLYCNRKFNSWILTEDILFILTLLKYKYERKWATINMKDKSVLTRMEETYQHPRIEETN